jgi:phage FluMu protein Com
MELRYCEKCHGIIVLEGRTGRMRPLERFLCTRCKSGEANRGRETRRSEEVTAVLKDLFDTVDLNLFSASTVAIRKAEMESATREKESSGDGCLAPAKTAQRLQFRCLHCRTMLKTKRVEVLSRVVCPKCKAVNFLDQTGVPSKTPPEGVSAERAGSRILSSGFRKTAQAEPTPP